MSYRKKYLARLGGICLSLTFIFFTGCVTTSPASSSPATKGPTQTHWDFHATRDTGSGDVWLLVER